MDRQYVGALGEKLAQIYFDKKGYHFLKQNCRYRFGEIDIIARDGGVTVFCEVKTRRTNFYGSGEESITYKKLQRMKKSALTYISENTIKTPWRLDVIIIQLDQNNKALSLRHYKNIS